MAKNPYEILGVEKSADAITLKRAYYTLVKKYPPEKFPAEFKELRSAYETLSDPARRAEYDGAAELPGDAAELFEQAKELRRTGRLAQAVEVYEKLLRLYPDLLQAQVALALAYEAQDKKGKAIKLWESVRVKEPGNAEYALELALGYEFRGWNKKALAEYGGVPQGQLTNNIV